MTRPEMDREQAKMHDNQDFSLVEKSDLPHKPLVEAILDIRWTLRPQANGAETDPHYKILLGSFFANVKEDYPFHEQLPAASLPDEMTPHVAQHRFRTGEKQWPLLQLGPGLLTLNDTKAYTWGDFVARSAKAAAALHETYPDSSEFHLKNVTLRYVDAIDFDYLEDDVFAFLRDKMRLNIGLPTGMFDTIPSENTPRHFLWQAAFPTHTPPGSLTLKFATGVREGRRALVWETSVETGDSGSPPNFPDGIRDWVESAHLLTHNVFFKMIEGELEESFS